MGDGRRTALAVLISVTLVAAAVASLWLMASAGVFTAEGAPLAGAPTARPDEAAAPVTFPPGGRVQVSQPRDPFEPLASVPLVIDGSSTTEGGETTSTSEGSTTTAGDGSTTSTEGGATTSTTAATTTTEGDDPIGTRIALLEIRDEQGVKRAVLTVDGQTHTVGVGDEFADDLKVVSLSDTSGVFQLADRVFSLAVGQSILK